MIKSMTGYGRAEFANDDLKIAVEIKSVNNRYLDIGIKMPRQIGMLESSIRAELKKYISRGKVDVYVSIGTGEDTAAEVTVNHQLVSGYLNAMKEISETYSVPNDVTVVALSRFPDVFTVHKAPEDEEKLTADVLTALAQATDAFVAMREAEGE